MDDGDRYAWVDIVEDLEEPQRKNLKRKKRMLSRKRSQLKHWKELQDEVLGELEDAIEVYEENISRTQGFVGGDTERFRKQVRELRQKKLGKKERFATGLMRSGTISSSSRRISRSWRTSSRSMNCFE